MTATFLAHAKVRFVPPEDTDAFERLLIQTWEASRAPWPDVVVPAESFMAYLAERLSGAGPNSPSEPLETLFEQLSLTDLYLACACMRGIAPAIAHLEANYLSKLPRLLGGSNPSDGTIDDVCQMVRMKLLVATPEGGPRIAEYTGRGTLLSWVRVIAVRIAGRMRPRALAEEFIPPIPTPGPTPDRLLSDERSRAALRQAIHEAFSVLPADKRHLIRLHVVDQLSMYELAALFRVNQSTISRWLKSARQMVYEETQRRLTARLGFSSRDFESFLQVLDSKFELEVT